MEKSQPAARRWIQRWTKKAEWDIFLFSGGLYFICIYHYPVNLLFFYQPDRSGYFSGNPGFCRTGKL